MMEKLWNYVRGLFNLVAEVERLRTDMKGLQEAERQRELNEQVMIARIRELAQKLEHRDQLQAAEARALKAELETALLRFERRLPPHKD